MLTENIVTSASVNIFKNRLDAFCGFGMFTNLNKLQSDDFAHTNMSQDQLTGYLVFVLVLAYFRAEAQ